MMPFYALDDRGRLGDSRPDKTVVQNLLHYSAMEPDQMLAHLTRCISDIWQVHAFPEGNTRVVAVFAIKYFRFLGFDVDNRVFQDHSWFFHNTLVRANYTNVRKRVDSDGSYRFCARQFGCNDSFRHLERRHSKS